MKPPTAIDVNEAHHDRPNATGNQPMMNRLKVRLPPRRMKKRLLGRDARSSSGIYAIP